MIIKRITTGFTQIPNAAIIDGHLSHGAFRMLAYLFSLPDAWNVKNVDIMRKCGINDHKTMAKYWQEIEGAGWASRDKHRYKGKLTGKTEVTLYEEKQEKNPIRKNTQCGENVHLNNTNSNYSSNINNTQLKKASEKKSEKSDGKKNSSTLKLNFDEEEKEKIEKANEAKKLTTNRLTDTRISERFSAKQYGGEKTAVKFPHMNIHEEIPDGVLTEEQKRERYTALAKEFINSESWINEFARVNSLSPVKVLGFIKEFFPSEINLKDNQNRTLKWTRQRFINWYKSKNEKIV